MKRILLYVVAFLLLGVADARGDIRPPPPPPKPPTKPTKPAFDPTTAVAGVAATAGLVFAGLWLAQSRRRIQVQS